MKKRKKTEKKKMAEGDSILTDTLSNRFFCHKCNDEIIPRLPDYLCPFCNSGFIEQLEGTHDSDSDTSSEMDDSSLDYFGPISGSMTESSVSSGSSSSGPPRHVNVTRRISGLPRRRINDRNVPTVIQDLLMQMATRVFEASMGGAEYTILPGGVDLGTGIPLMITSNLASNPGDYAWGRGSFDAIISQLMNQLDGSGPPPLSNEKIDLIPAVKINKEQCDIHLQCSVCMEDFKLNEKVRKLKCEHFYHDYCIVPWLKLHATCPVCRKILCEDRNEFSDSRLNFESGPSSSSSARSNLQVRAQNSESVPIRRTLTEDDLD